MALDKKSLAAMRKSIAAARSSATAPVELDMGLIGMTVINKLDEIGSAEDPEAAEILMEEVSSELEGIESMLKGAVEKDGMVMATGELAQLFKRDTGERKNVSKDTKSETDKMACGGKKRRKKTEKEDEDFYDDPEEEETDEVDSETEETEEVAKSEGGWPTDFNEGRRPVYRTERLTKSEQALPGRRGARHQLRKARETRLRQIDAIRGGGSGRTLS